MLTLICQMSTDGATIMKWTKNFVQATNTVIMKDTNNFLRVPEKHEHRKCTGFTYCGAKIFNSPPINIRETQDSIIFKKLV